MSVRLRRLGVVVSACVLAPACTIVRPDSRRTLDVLDHNLTPASSTARALLLPVAVPVGIGGILTDTLLVNPIHAIDDAWLDMVDVLWTSDDETPLRRALFVPLAALATPVVFAGDWLGRCVLPLPPRKEGK